MSAAPSSPNLDERPRSGLRQLLTPVCFAGAVCCALFFAAKKSLRQAPEPKSASKWRVTWVELSNFKKPREAAQQQKR
jgi:hypothetical protein